MFEKLMCFKQGGGNNHRSLMLLENVTTLHSLFMSCPQSGSVTFLGVIKASNFNRAITLGFKHSSNELEVITFLYCSNLLCEMQKLIYCYCVGWGGRCCWCCLCKYVTWSMGCLGVGEAARGEQLIANQGQEWMGIRTMKKRSWFSK
jgi:hypothetical protein